MSGVPDEMPDIPQVDDPGKYDRLCFRVGGAVSVVGIALISFFFYDGVHAEESLAAMADVTHLRVEATILGGAIVLFGLAIAVGGPIAYREFR